MPPKRRAVQELTSNKPKKIAKIDFDKKKCKELELALEKNNDERVLKLSLEFLKSHTSSSKLATRLLKFFVKACNAQLVCKLLKHANLDLKTPEGNELLRQAVDKAQVEIAEMLVHAGVDLNCKSENGNTILHEVLSSYMIKDQGKKEKLALVMLEHGANVNAINENGFSILQKAITYKFSTTFIETLLQHGAIVRIGRTHHENDIFYTVQYKPKLLSMLIKHGVPDEETRHKRGVMAIEYLMNSDHQRKLEMIQNTLNLGVPINHADPKNPLGVRGCSLLHSALKNKKKDLIELLLKNGADANQKDDHGLTPLFIAAMMFKGFSDVSRLLITHGASIHQQNNDGRYPIHGACQNESLRNVHLLLNLGASLAVTSNKGYSPFRNMTIYNISLTDAGRLVIKHFALMTSRGIPILEKDHARINLCHDVSMFYDSCLEELDNMKKKMVCGNISYFSLLSGRVKDALIAVENAEFVQTFNENITKIHDFIIIYYFDLLISFNIALKKLKILESMQKLLKKMLKKTIPTVVINKIAYYASLEKMMNHEKEAYLALHQNAKHNKLGKQMLI